MIGHLDVLNCGLGHMKVSFDKDDHDEHAKAKKMIQDMLRRGYTILVETEQGTRRVKRFDQERSEYLIESLEPGIGNEASIVKRTRRLPMSRTKATAVGRTRRTNLGRRAQRHRARRGRGIMSVPNFICTKDNTWAKGKNEPGQRVEHPDAVEVDETDYGGGEYCVGYKCPHCGKYFEVELPQ